MSTSPKTSRTATAPARAGTTVAVRLEAVRSMYGFHDLKAFWRRIGQEADDGFRVSYATVRNYHQGEREPSFAYIAHVIKTFPDIRLEWLVLGEEPATKTEEVAHDIFADPQVPLPAGPWDTTPIQRMAEQIFGDVPQIDLPDFDVPDLARIMENVQLPELERVAEAFEKLKETLEKAAPGGLFRLRAEPPSERGLEDDFASAAEANDEATEPDDTTDAGVYLGGGDPELILADALRVSAGWPRDATDRLRRIFPYYLAVNAASIVHHAGESLVLSALHSNVEEDVSQTDVGTIAFETTRGIAELLADAPRRFELSLDSLPRAKIRGYINLMCQAIEMLIPDRPVTAIPIPNLTPEAMEHLSNFFGPKTDHDDT